MVYQSINRQTFLVTASNEDLDYFATRPVPPGLIKKIKQGFSHFNSFSVYLNNNFLVFNDDDLLIKLLYNVLAGEAGEIFINAQVKDRLTVKISSGKISEAINLKQNIQSDYDLIFSFDNFSRLLADWENKLLFLSPTDHLIWSNYFKSKSDFELLKNIISQANHIVFILDRDDGDAHNRHFGLLIETDDSPTAEAKVKDLLKIMLANKFPKRKYKYLSDGARVSELIADPSQFDFFDLGELQAIEVNSSLERFFYKVTDNYIVFGNHQPIMEVNPADFSNSNSLIISTDLLTGSNNIEKYFKSFGFIMAD